MARAKRTERAEARRRHRSTAGAVEVPDLEIDEAEGRTDDSGGDPARRPCEAIRGRADVPT